MYAPCTGCMLLQQWSSDSGFHMCSFSTKDTRPSPGVWPEAVELADGHWSWDGTSLVVTDVAGQLHFYGFGQGRPCFQGGLRG